MELREHDSPFQGGEKEKRKGVEVLASPDATLVPGLFEQRDDSPPEVLRAEGRLGPEGGKRVVGLDSRVQDRAAPGDGFPGGNTQACRQEETQLLDRVFSAARRRVEKGTHGGDVEAEGFECKLLFRPEVVVQPAFFQARHLHDRGHWRGPVSVPVQQAAGLAHDEAPCLFALGHGYNLRPIGLFLSTGRRGRFLRSVTDLWQSVHGRVRGSGSMNNRELADTFTLIANLLEIKGETVYVTLAYRKAAESLLSLGGDVNQYWKEEKLREIPGVGKSIAEKIDELLKTGRLAFLEKLEKEVPAGLAEWLQVPGLGPKKAALIWKELGITTLEELTAAAREGKLRALPGNGGEVRGADREGDRVPRAALGTRSARPRLAAGAADHRRAEEGARVSAPPSRPDPCAACARPSATWTSWWPRRTPPR